MEIKSSVISLEHTTHRDAIGLPILIHVIVILYIGLKAQSPKKTHSCSMNYTCAFGVGGENQDGCHSSNFKQFPHGMYHIMKQLDNIVAH